MVDLSAVEKSKELYELAKDFFISKNLPDCLIEISNKPFEEWEVYYTKSLEDLGFSQSHLWAKKLPYISVYIYKDEKYFSFSDVVIDKKENLSTGEVIYDELSLFFTTDYAALRKEFLELRKMLQGA